MALIVAAGRGRRAQTGQPKQYVKLGGKAMLRWAIDAFARHQSIVGVRVVIHPDDGAAYDAATMGLAMDAPVLGGSTRQASVRAGLEALADGAPQRVLIHDGARPFVSSALIENVVVALDRAPAAVPLLGLSDTLRRKVAGGFEIVPRSDLLGAQTPQGFHFADILAAHRKFENTDASDDMALAQAAGLTVASVAGEHINMKLTTPDDFVLAERLALGTLGDVRSGTGFDVHRFVAGDHIFLCGVKLAHTRALEGHSDADVGLHAITDAIFGALGAGDIGAHFPSSDPRWRGAASRLFLEYAAKLVREKGGTIAHVDVTLICEAPKIGPHREAMRASISEILHLDPQRVGVKATTTEGLGFTGRGEGIAAQAIATIRLPG